ncbi:MAG TPA: tetratricopeptide repeat protein [Candidatus Acidoferrales bacterium]|nr:tetratricopeptide repeat protein [Candidatus Acidoferrales bacterium]
MRYVFIASVMISAAASTGAASQTSEWAQMVNRADTLDQKGQYQEAALGYESALRLAATLGPGDRRLQLTLNKLALTYDALGRYSDAIRLYQRALALVEHAKGKNSQEYASLLNNLSAVYVEEGDFGRAEPLIRQAMAIDEALLQPDSPQLAKARSVLADVLIKRAKYSEADHLLAQAIHVFENQPGGQRDVGIALNNLAFVRRKEKQNVESRRLLEQALAVIESDSGPDHPLLARVHNNLGDTYAALGLRDLADAAYRRSIQISEAQLGPEHPQFGIMLHNYAGFLRDCGRKSEAKVLEARSRAALQQSARLNGVGMTVDVSSFRQK